MSQEEQVKHLASAFNSSGPALAAPGIMNPRIEYWNVPLMRDTAASSGRRISNRVHIVFSSERRAHMTRRDHVVVGWSALSPPPPRDVGTLSGQKKAFALVQSRRSKLSSLGVTFVWQTLDVPRAPTASHRW
jgi:hypothetical protein